MFGVIRRQSGCRLRLDTIMRKCAMIASISVAQMVIEGGRRQLSDLAREFVELLAMQSPTTAA
jgi:hypothetical protein